jgi:gamma-butyrobetaine dioxygenase/trimethyllysine dioxygenase
LRVRFGARHAAHADFHWFWPPPVRLLPPPADAERTLRPSDVPLEITPRSVALSPDFARLFVVWPDPAGEHASEYALDWLRANAYAPDAAEIAQPPSDAAELELRAAHSARGRSRRCVERAAAGAALVRGAGLDTKRGSTPSPAAARDPDALRPDRGSAHRQHHEPEHRPARLHDAAVDLHTDQPFLASRRASRCCTACSPRTGGDTRSPTRAAAEYLRRTDEHAYALLSTVPIRFHRVQKSFEKLYVSPLLELRDGALFRVRSSYFTMAPQLAPFERMEAWYRAYQSWERLVGDPSHSYRFRLEAGDFLLYDNWRMLHARTRFTARWARGVYFDSPADVRP